MSNHPSSLTDRPIKSHSEAFSLLKHSLTQLFFLSFFRQGFIRAPAATGKSKNKEVSLACSFWSGSVGLFLLWGEDRNVSGVRPEGWLGCFADTLGGVMCRGISSTLFLLQTPCLFKSGIWIFQSLCIFCPEFAQLCMHAVNFSPMEFLCIFLL